MNKEFRLTIGKTKNTWFCQLQEFKSYQILDGNWYPVKSVEDESYLGLMTKVADEGWIDKLNANE